MAPTHTKGNPEVHSTKPPVHSHHGPSVTSKKHSDVHSTATHKKESATTAHSVTKSHKSATKSKTTLSRTSKSSSHAPTVTGVAKWEGENNQHLCKDGQMNTGSWKANNVDHYLKQLYVGLGHCPFSPPIHIASD